MVLWYHASQLENGKGATNMLTFLIVFGIAVAVVSAGITIVACAASARLTENESWGEEPLTATQPGTLGRPHSASVRSQKTTAS